ncbi:hypothetical protein NLN62_48225 (plasmid) [Bradyrhizobium sp. CCGUVB23]|nr:hypothetical protein [Bradyrhizobium sp. CCGUVB23]MCP3468000.1 hypothetical protein [Bradyrhizobium sp. CCGUVB23]
MTALHGVYIDHQMTTPFAMAQLSAKIKPFATDLARTGVLLLTTCVRVEAYGEESSLRSIDRTMLSGFSYERIEGAVAIARRLAQIASSAHSQILGESYVSHQLANSIELVDPNLPIFQVARFGLDMGRAARERQKFIASFNYDQIVRDIIAHRFQNGEPPDRLYIIGAGMLGRGLIGSGVGERFRSTTVVTRNPKTLRKRLRPYADLEVTLMRPEEIGQEPEPRSFVVIATAEVNQEYEAILRKGLLRLEPRTIVDLSSIPTLSDASAKNLNYVSMYSKEFLRFIEDNNRDLAPKLPLLFSDIEATLRTVQIHLSA